MNQKTPPEISFAKYFVWVAWIIAIGLLVFFFQDLLDKQWNPNSSPEFRLSNTGKAEVLLEQNRAGHYVVKGTINGKAVTFLLDTGATNVSIPAHIADNLNLTSTGSHIAQTANGNVRVYATRLNELSIGNLFLYDVSASINPGMKSDEILLGMSALKQVEFNQYGTQLTLKER